MGIQKYKSIICSSLCIFIFFVIDRILKNLFSGELLEKRFYYFGDNIVLAFQRNEGISYGLPVPEWLIIVLTLIIIMVIIFFIAMVIRKKDNFFYSPLTIILLGSFSNLIDRIRYGYVIDMLNLGNIISFNIADAMILIGAIWLIISYWRSSRLTGIKKADNLN